MGLAEMDSRTTAQQRADDIRVFRTELQGAAAALCDGGITHSARKAHRMRTEADSDLTDTVSSD